MRFRGRLAALAVLAGAWLLASGPGIRPGDLRSGAEYGSINAPTLLDLAPTALDWLGYSREEYERFGREEFPRYLESWIRSQRSEILSQLDAMDSLERARKEANLETLSLAPLLPRIERLLLFIETDRDQTLSSLRARPMQGNLLELK